MKTLILTFILVFSFYFGFSQNVGINDDGSAPDSSAQLDVKSTNKGILIPRMDSATRVGIANPAIGLMVYQTNGAAGYYYYDGTSWMSYSVREFAFANVDAKIDYAINDWVKWNGTIKARNISVSGTGNTFFSLKAHKTYRIDVSLSPTLYSGAIAEWAVCLSTGTNISGNTRTESTVATWNDAVHNSGHVIYTPQTDCYIGVRWLNFDGGGSPNVWLWGVSQSSIIIQEL